MTPVTPEMTPTSERSSLRTCIGCRRRAPAETLARVALEKDGDVGRLVFWGPGRARPAGRGASLHRDASCLRAALKSGAFARAFRGQVKTDRIGDEADLLQRLAATSRKDKDRKSP
jgi:predicted RNA-binding protein YlxR (DUF448 family)